MAKVVTLISSTLLVALSTAAFTFVPPTIGTSIKNAVQPSQNARVIKTSFPMIYGGQDISRVAKADAAVWAGQPVLIG